MAGPLFKSRLRPCCSRRPGGTVSRDAGVCHVTLERWCRCVAAAAPAACSLAAAGGCGAGGSAAACCRLRGVSRHEPRQARCTGEEPPPPPPPGSCTSSVATTPAWLRVGCTASTLSRSCVWSPPPPPVARRGWSSVDRVWSECPCARSSADRARSPAARRGWSPPVH